MTAPRSQLAKLDLTRGRPAPSTPPAIKETALAPIVHLMDPPLQLLAPGIAGRITKMSPAHWAALYMLLFAAGLGTGRLAEIPPRTGPASIGGKPGALFVNRPNIIDRSGRLLAADVDMPNPLGLSARRRAYPAGGLAGHVIGGVDPGNIGITGIERLLDEANRTRQTPAHVRPDLAPVRLSLDAGVQHTVAAELGRAIEATGAHHGAGVLMDVDTGEIVASVSLPERDPGVPAILQGRAITDHALSSQIDIGDLIAVLERGALLDGSSEARRPLFARLGLHGALRTETGTTSVPRGLTRTTGDDTSPIATARLAVAPVQLAAVVARLVNRGTAISPTFLAHGPNPSLPGDAAAIDPEARARLRSLFWLDGTDQDAYRLGGLRLGGADGTSTAFAGVFPLAAPRFVVVVAILDLPDASAANPVGKPVAADAARDAARRIVAWAAPLLGIRPEPTLLPASDASAPTSNTISTAAPRPAALAGARDGL